MKRIELQNFRIKNKLTQEQMANKLDITFAHYKAIEYCQRNPSFELLKRFKIEFPRANVDKIFLSWKFILSIFMYVNVFICI